MTSKDLAKKLSYEELSDKFNKIADFFHDGIYLKKQDRLSYEDSLIYLRNYCIKNLDGYSKKNRELIIQKLKLIDENVHDYMRARFIDEDKRREHERKNFSK